MTGLASVRLVNATEESPPLAKAPPGEPLPVIAEGESSMQQVTDTLYQLARRTDETMQRLNATLSPNASLDRDADDIRRVSRVRKAA